MWRLPGGALSLAGSLSGNCCSKFGRVPATATQLNNLAYVPKYTNTEIQKYMDTEKTNTQIAII